jgi:hypothetical protein
MPTLEIWMLARLARPAKTLANRFFSLEDAAVARLL